ncbi:unnamed protein product [Cercopithifilaria johnstoni]|uniref:Uncharacterized protein n=1 Tax=Cercopithifilaria johnstoni TaxID=2874296 RepID=A0A8J2PQ72_9BILA|nr:unnamed protein product [Cercopithifilaria johnstoni]
MIQIRRRLCASLQKCTNRLHWKTLSFVINHCGNSLQFSIQATVSPSLKFEKEQKPPVSSNQEQQEQKATKLKTSPKNRPAEDNTLQESLKQAMLLEAKKNVKLAYSNIKN